MRSADCAYGWVSRAPRLHISGPKRAPTFSTMRTSSGCRCRRAERGRSARSLASRGLLGSAQVACEPRGSPCLTCTRCEARGGNTAQCGGPTRRPEHSSSAGHRRYNLRLRPEAKPPSSSDAQAARRCLMVGEDGGPVAIGSHQPVSLGATADHRVVPPLSPRNDRDSELAATAGPLSRRMRIQGPQGVGPDVRTARDASADSLLLGVGPRSVLGYRLSQRFVDESLDLRFRESAALCAS